MKNVKLTKQGFEIIKNELEDLIKIKKPKAVERLKSARNMGDLSENSEYSASKEELEIIENRIHNLQDTIKNAEIVNDNHNNFEVSLGSNVIVESNGKESCFNIVGEFEADPLQNKLSITSPIGQALIGKKTGEVVEIVVPAGKIQYKILKIS